MDIGPLTIDIGRREEELVATECPIVTADDLLETAEDARGILETTKRRFGENSVPGAEVQVERLFREAKEAKAAEEAGRVAVENCDSGRNH